jgi:hypothetical protein
MIRKKSYFYDNITPVILTRLKKCKPMHRTQKKAASLMIYSNLNIRCLNMRVRFVFAQNSIRLLMHFNLKLLMIV